MEVLLEHLRGFNVGTAAPDGALLAGVSPELVEQIAALLMARGFGKTTVAAQPHQKLVPGPTVTGHTPSVDVFFGSLATHVGRNAAACLLTGMGADGAAGLLRLRLQGGRTPAQNRETSVVWGMPAAAQALGAADSIIALEAIPAALVEWAASVCASQSLHRRRLCRIWTGSVHARFSPTGRRGWRRSSIRRVDSSAVGVLCDGRIRARLGCEAAARAANPDRR